MRKLLSAFDSLAVFVLSLFFFAPFFCLLFLSVARSLFGEREGSRER